MTAFVAAALAAFWLGLLTAISPCPMATNLAAISFIGKRLASPGRVLLGGLVYTGGRAAAYVAVGVVAIVGLLSSPTISQFLQVYMNKLLGPVLILVGMVLVELVRPSFSVSAVGAKVQAQAEKGGLWGAGLLGFLFALSFCPISAGYFFLSLVPLAIRHESRVILPAVYGIATALPVVGFAVLVAFGANRVGQAFNRLKQWEWWARRVTGIVFILVGVYYCLTYIFGLVPSVDRWLR